MKRSAFSGKVVMITGSSSGIGEAMARAFSQAGAKLVLVARREERLKILASELKNCLIMPADISSEDEVKGLIEKTINFFGRIDVLINNAASIIVVPAEKVTVDDLLKGLMTNLCGPAVLTQSAFRQMEKQGGGQIINIGSPGFMMGIPFYAPYVCSKAAFSAWTRTIQSEWADSCVKISEYFPGYIRTNSDPESRIGQIQQDFLMEEKQNFIAKHFTRPQTPEQVANQILRIANKPQILKCSSIKVKLGTFISNVPSFRLIIASQMAKTARTKLKLYEKNYSLKRT